MISNKKGFTLIELIIVMAIIGILAVVGIVSISGKAQEARNAKRKSDMSTVISAMAMHCTDKVIPEECPNDGTNKNVLSNCKSPGNYINLATINDPSNKGKSVSDRCTEYNKPCNYTIILEPGSNSYNQCDPKILFVTESGTKWKSACARNNGIQLEISQQEFNNCK